MRASKSGFTALLGLVAMALTLAACEAASGPAALAAQPGASVPNATLPAFLMKRPSAAGPWQKVYSAL